MDGKITAIAKIVTSNQCFNDTPTARMSGVHAGSASFNNNNTNNNINNINILIRVTGLYIM